VNSLISVDTEIKRHAEGKVNGYRMVLLSWPSDCLRSPSRLTALEVVNKLTVTYVSEPKMKNNLFHGCSQPIEETELDVCEAVLAHRLPGEFRQHYLKNNGGVPEDGLFRGTGEWEPLEVAGFYPIPILAEHYHAMCAKRVIPDRMLPFAYDPGGNFFCLDLHEGSVRFYATDGFDPALSVAENFAKAQRRLAGSFKTFMGELTHNPEYDSDEWPE
jgi:hypothetical protein